MNKDQHRLKMLHQQLIADIWKIVRKTSTTEFILLNFYATILYTQSWAKDWGHFTKLSKQVFIWNPLQLTFDDLQTQISKFAFQVAGWEREIKPKHLRGFLRLQVG